MKFNGWYKEDTVQNKSNVLKELISSYTGCVTDGNFPQKKKKKKKKLAVTVKGFSREKV